MVIVSHRNQGAFGVTYCPLRSTEASREDNVYMAKLAEQAERYEGMVEFMEKVVKIVDYEELTEGIMEVISSIEQKEESRGNEDHVKLIKDYRATIETKLSKICDGILGLLDSHLVPSASSSEYLAEFKTGADRKEAAMSTLLAYKSAQVGEMSKVTMVKNLLGPFG
ncbi:putative 14-3-3 protein [Helianthus anomalus]